MSLTLIATNLSVATLAFHQFCKLGTYWVCFYNNKVYTYITFCMALTGCFGTAAKCGTRHQQLPCLLSSTTAFSKALSQWPCDSTTEMQTLISKLEHLSLFWHAQLIGKQAQQPVLYYHKYHQSLHNRLVYFIDANVSWTSGNFHTGKKKNQKKNQQHLWCIAIILGIYHTML